MISIITIVDFLGFLFILIAAFTISSKYVVYPKVRLFAFSCYMAACFFLITWGLLTTELTMFIWQQVVLIGINVKGIWRAVKELKGMKKEKDPFEAIVPKNIWKDILEGYDD